MYTLTICFGMFLSICGSQHKYEFPTLAECQEARKAVPLKSIGDGYAICAPKKEPTQ